MQRQTPQDENILPATAAETNGADEFHLAPHFPGNSGCGARTAQTV
jgi:hypothetical protein